MATANDLMGLGLPPQLAAILGRTPSTVTGQGASLASATRCNYLQKVIYVNATNGGAGVVLATVGGADGYLLGDLVSVTNEGTPGGNVTLYLANSAKLLLNGASVAGATGISVTIGQTVLLQPVTSSVWVGVRSSV